jgi:hypothetical protein
VRRVFAVKTVGIFIFVLGLFALPSKAMAVPVACGGGADVLSYNDPSIGGCFVDGLLFSEFAVFQAGGAQEVMVNGVIANVVGGTVFFNFNPNLDGDGNEDIHFYFKVSSLSGADIINGVDLENNGTGDTSIQESVCTVSWLVTFGCVSNGGTVIATLLAGSGEFDQAFFDPRSSAYIFKDISKDEGGHLTSFTQSFHVPDGGSTLALLGLSLMGLREIRRRFPRR